MTFVKRLARTFYPADAVIVTVIVCSVVTVVLVGASNLNHRERVPLAVTDNPVWSPAKMSAEQVWSEVVKS
jgi:hypothetical protein